MSKALILSDLHLELEKEDTFRLRKIEGVEFLILAGDIGRYNSHLEFIKDATSKYTVIYVLGNHEFYGNTIHDVVDYWENVNLPNFHFLNNNCVILKNIRFIGSTLWTNYFNENPLVMNDAFSSGMRDYERIKSSIYHGYNINPNEILEIFKSSFSYLQKTVSMFFDGNTVVITHHAPSMKSIAKKFLKNEFFKDNYLFASHLDDFIKNNKIDFWIHGHVHSPFDYMIGKTRVVCNPRGYNFESRFGSFEYKIINLSRD
jgi:predicted phosphodiesterase